MTMRSLANRPHIRQALHQSIVSAYLVYGFPADCINADKWMPDVNHAMLFLGFLVDARSMTVTWPLQKRTELRDEILATLKDRRGQASPIAYASTLGKLRPPSRIASRGVYITWSMQRSLT